MKLFDLLCYSSLLVLGKKPTTWIIDGNNLLAQKGTSKDREVLAEKLKSIHSIGAESVVLVFDGRPGDSFLEHHQGSFQQVQLAEGVSSDHYILEEIAAIVATSKVRRVQVVTADRELRRLALESRPIVKGVINPITFWKKYLPRMAGWKKAEILEPQTELSTSIGSIKK